MKPIKKTPKKRTRRDPDSSRKLILDATEKIMLDQGYASVTTRRVAKEVGVNPALVHYYYPTIDDLLISLHRRLTERHLNDLEETFKSNDPLGAFWKIQANWPQSKLGVEFLAMGNHRQSLRKEIARTTEQARRIQAKGLQSFLVAPKGLAAADHSPIAIVTLLVGIARMLTNEENVGIEAGHVEARKLVDWAVTQVSRQR